MSYPLQPFAESIVKLAQSNVSVWTQFWMSPDQPWSLSRWDWASGKPVQSAAPPVPSGEALGRLWSGLVENQTRFMREVTERGMTASNPASLGAGALNPTTSGSAA